MARDFSPAPMGRFVKQGPFTGEAFRLSVLTPVLQDPFISSIIVDFSETEVPGSAFLEEAFGGLLRADFLYEELKDKLRIVSVRATEQMRIWDCIDRENNKLIKKLVGSLNTPQS